jgi:hypothetical protein
VTDPAADPGMEAVYQDYVATFNREDGAGVARLLSYPVVVEGTDRPPEVIPDASSYQRMIEAVFAQFKARGWARSQIDRLQSFLMAGDTGVLVAHYSRYRADGSLLETGHGHYVVRKSGGRWTICAALAT